MIKISYPELYEQRARYVIEWVFLERFGLEATFIASRQVRHWTIQGTGAGGKLQICFEKTFLDSCSETSLASFEGVPFARKDFDSLGITPIDFPGMKVPLSRERQESHDAIFAIEENDFLIKADLLGAIFVILTGIPESRGERADRYDRHSDDNTSWIGEHLTQYPLVDYYVEIIRVVMERQFGVKIFQRDGRETRPSHDVDSPSAFQAMRPRTLCKRLGALAICEQNPMGALKAITGWGAVRFGACLYDPHDHFDWIMEQSEKRSLQSTFYFITDHSDPTKDGCYSLSNRFIRKLLVRIHERGHLIGLHPSSNTYLDLQQMQKEFDRLLSCCKTLGIHQEEWGTRQHCLKWRNPDTARILASVGLSHDSTLGDAHRAGFRNGTSHEFPIFDHENNQKLSLIEKPLIVMDCSIVDERYFGLGHGEKAFSLISELKGRCFKFGGNFEILWHNNRFENPDEKTLYLSSLDS